MTVAVVLGLFLALLALACAAFWAMGIIEGLRRDQNGKLRAGFILLLDTRGMLTTTVVFGVPVPLVILGAVTHVPFNDSLIPVIFFTELSLVVVLWGVTLFLRFKPKQPAYRFHLPGDAEKVRIQGCEDGIWLAATGYPRVLARDWLDIFTRAMEVSARASTFPQGKKAEVQLTNDFAVYCDLVVEGCEKGYYGFIEKVHTLPDQFEGILTQLQQGDPTPEEVHALLQTLAQQILHGEEESTGE
ncbi:MAG: hypothetical protein E6J34_00780 [Chloroflexi bacterium]|nr:MAG: hypothetical protein E6J34_00780 [Chloroflexota bacterium]